jgi:hypothetical protein
MTDLPVWFILLSALFSTMGYIDASFLVAFARISSASPWLLNDVADVARDHENVKMPTR